MYYLLIFVLNIFKIKKNEGNTGKISGAKRIY